MTFLINLQENSVCKFYYEYVIGQFEKLNINN